MSTAGTFQRRDFLGGLATAGLVGSSAPSWAETSTRVTSPLPSGARVPMFDFVYESSVSIAPVLDFGVTPEGHRRIIPITGGSFHGPAMRGEVVSNGADWNLQRADGTGSVEAAYYLKTDDGVLIRIVNKGVSGPVGGQDTKGGEQFLMFTSPTFEAPTGRYDWMNHTLFVGTLNVRPDVHGAVLIRVFKVV